MCLYPKLIPNPKYRKNKKNGGNIPAVSDPRVLKVPIGCGNCIECRKQKCREWQIRLHEEIKNNTIKGLFITLTFSNESINKLICENEHLQKLSGYELDNEIATKAVRLWLERWRKKFKKSLKHWLVTELGHNGTENIHLHGIIWTNEPVQNLTTTWQYGYIWTGKGDNKTNYVNSKTINYIIKYINKVDLDHKEYKSKILTSPGIGSRYTLSPECKSNTFRDTETKETYRMPSGHVLSLPIYFRNKIYTENEREKLWLQKLDKGERWICGQKIKETDTEAYYNLLTYYREKNNTLGYGNDEKNWDREQYELERRKLMYEKRLNNAKQIQTNNRRKNNNNSNNNNN